MTRDEVRQAIIDILGDIAPDEDMSSLKDDISLREQMDLDSMDFLDIEMQHVSMASCIHYLQPLLKDHQLASQPLSSQPKTELLPHLFIIF